MNIAHQEICHSSFQIHTYALYTAILNAMPIAKSVNKIILYFLQSLVPYPCQDLITTRLSFPLQEPWCLFSLELITTQVPFWCYVPPMPHLPPPCSHQATPPSSHACYDALSVCSEAGGRGRARSTTDIRNILRTGPRSNPEPSLPP